MTKILQNAVKVGDEILISNDVHDYLMHDGIMIDGGRDYLKRSGDWTRPDVTDLTICDDEPIEQYYYKLLWGVRTEGVVTYKFMYNLDSDHLGNILRTQKNAAAHAKKCICYILHQRAKDAIRKAMETIGDDYTTFNKNHKLAIKVSEVL